MKSTQKPLAITMGDPSGIGPEIIVASLGRQSVGINNIVFGCPKVIARAVKLSKRDFTVRVLDQVDDAEF